MENAWKFIGDNFLRFLSYFMPYIRCWILHIINTIDFTFVQFLMAFSIFISAFRMNVVVFFSFLIWIVPFNCWNVFPSSTTYFTLHYITLGFIVSYFDVVQWIYVLSFALYSQIFFFFENKKRNHRRWYERNKRLCICVFDTIIHSKMCVHSFQHWNLNYFWL